MLPPTRKSATLRVTVEDYEEHKNLLQALLQLVLAVHSKYYLPELEITGVIEGWKQALEAVRLCEETLS